MAGDESAFRYLGCGTGLAIEVSGPTVESCLARAVEGLGNAIAVVHPSVACRPVAVDLAVDSGSPAALLRAVLDAAVDRLVNDGEVALALAAVDREGDRMRATLSVAPLAAARPPVVAKAPTWQGVDLQRNGRGWTGMVLAEL